MADQHCSKTGLCYQTSGTGDPILCLHGLGANLYTWRNLVAPLRKDYQVVLVDLKGFGKSPKPRDKKYSLKDHADAIYQFIIEQDFRNLTLLGNSYGGAVALLVAIMLGENEPERLSKLILIDSAGYNESLPWHVRLLRTPLLGWLTIHVAPPPSCARTTLKYGYYDKSKITAEQVAAYAQPMAAPKGRYALLQTARQAIPKDFDQLVTRYSEITVPTLLIWGEADRVVPLSIAKKLRTAISSSQLIVIPETGHVPQEESPEKIVPLILEFLSSRQKSCG